MAVTIFGGIWIMSVFLGVSASDDRALWNAAVSGAKTNLSEMDYACEYTFKGGFASTFDDALVGNYRRVSESQLFDFSEAAGRIVKLGDNVRFKIHFTNPTDYHDKAGSFSMRSDDRMTGQGISVTYVPPQHNIFSDQMSTGIAYAHRLEPSLDRFRLSHHSNFIFRSPCWGSVEQLEQFSSTDAFDPVLNVEVLKKDEALIRFRIERRDYPSSIIEFDSQGEYPVLTYIGTGLDPRTGHHFSDIRTLEDGFRCPLNHTFIAEPEELKGADGIFWNSWVWTAKEFVAEPKPDDFTLDWPGGTVSAGQLKKDVSSVNLFDVSKFVASAIVPINDHSPDIMNQESEVGGSWVPYGATIIVLVLVFALVRLVLRDRV
ncbi:MAG: hypothetical protein Q8M16_02725 [Pirellulaceae bacterium]|nr:hypothetical protein [Pirellulaceae bacterium]